jgi:hypothetical protein
VRARARAGGSGGGGGGHYIVPRYYGTAAADFGENEQNPLLWKQISGSACSQDKMGNVLF